MVKKTRLDVERLEDRTTPAIFGNAWPDAEHLTASFAPDGTIAGTQTSSLLQKMDATIPRAVWQKEILRALQTWAVLGNINVGLVPDKGTALGSAAPFQGDSRFGDIRFVGTALASDALAVAQPFDLSAGSWSGDVNFNSKFTFGVTSTAKYDLFSVALHEVGHVLGVPGNNDPTSVMYQQYNGARAGLSAADIQAVQALYGTRGPDAQDADKPNNSLASATQLRLELQNSLLRPVTVDGDISSHSDVDFYQLQVETEVGGGVTIRLNVAGRSLLTPRLTIYDASGKLLLSAATTDVLQNNLSLHLSNVKLFSTYFIKVEGNSKDVFGIGGYRLQITPDAPTAPPPSLVNDDHHGNDDILTATDLRGPRLTTADVRFDLSVQASLSDPKDIDFYRLRTPQSTGTVLTATVWATSGNLPPAIDVYDALGVKVAATVLVNENGTYTVQVTGAAANKDYFIAVRLAQSAAAGSGNYFLGVDFGTKAVTLNTLTGGTLTKTAPEQARLLQISQTQLMHLSLAAQSAGAPESAAVRFRIYDQTGKLIATLDVLSGQTRTLTLYMTPGTYMLEAIAGAKAGTALSSVSYQVRAIGISDPIGPQPISTTGTPVTAPPPPTPSTTYYLWSPDPLQIQLWLANPSLAPDWFLEMPMPLLALAPGTLWTY